MNQELEIKKNLKNAEGKRLLEKTKLDYSENIIQELYNNPQMLDEILNDMEITEQEFFDNLSGDKNANITFYDQVLILTKQRKNQ